MTSQFSHGLIIISTCVFIILFVFIGRVSKKVSIFKFRSTDICGGKVELIFEFQKPMFVVSKRVVQSYFI